MGGFDLPAGWPDGCRRSAEGAAFCDDGPCRLESVLLMSQSYDSATLTERLKQRARELGFDLAGVCPAVAPPGIARFETWLAAGYAGTMRYLPDRADAYRHPRHVLPGARSLLVLSMNYRTVEAARAGPTEGRVSRYAWGVDYHDVIRRRLNQLADFLREAVPQAEVRGVVDTAPLLEREFAQLAGLGWIGKNTLLLNRERGSYFFLAVLLTDLVLHYDAAHEADHCGTCRACLDACPTGAFVDEYVLDARRCISYLTIELRGPVDPSLREPLGNWVFGCDICQEVCPWNRKAVTTDMPEFAPAEGMNPLELTGLFALDDEAFRKRFRHSPLWRARRRGLLRNAALVLGNAREVRALEALVRGLNDTEPLVRGACAWALGRLGGPKAIEALRKRAAVETDRDVCEELRRALPREVGVDDHRLGGGERTG